MHVGTKYLHSGSCIISEMNLNTKVKARVDANLQSVRRSVHQPHTLQFFFIFINNLKNLVNYTSQKYVHLLCVFQGR